MACKMTVYRVLLLGLSMLPSAVLAQGAKREPVQRGTNSTFRSSDHPLMLTCVNKHEGDACRTPNNQPGTCNANGVCKPISQ